ncbi:cytosine permease [Luminiphilus sp.]|nr:cytosine permease [Luminiphilus sp.]MDA9721882.1 cytosine permease [Luminiphilus sp.]
MKSDFWSQLNDKFENTQAESGPVSGSDSLVRICMIWLAGNLVVTTQLTGTLFIPGVAWHAALGLIAVGSLFGGAVLVLVGNMGKRTGLPTMALTKGALGLRGATIPTTINVGILMGWAWVQAMLAGVTLDHYLSPLIGFSNPILLSMTCQVAVVCLAIFGHRGLTVVEPLFAVSILAVMYFALYGAFSDYDLHDFVNLEVDINLGWNVFSVLDVVVATAVSWTVLSAEICRRAVSERASIVGTGLGYVLSTTLSMSFGATALAYVILDGREFASFSPIPIVSAFGLPVAIIFFLSVMATNVLCIYGMVASIVNLPRSRTLKFLPTTLIVGLLAILGCAWLPLLSAFTDFLTLIGGIFIPVFAIMVADYYFVNRGCYDRDILLTKGGKYWFNGGYNPAGLLIWLFGAIFSHIMSYHVQSPIGSFLPTFLLVFIIYLLWASVAGRLLKSKPNSVNLSRLVSKPHDS